MVGYLIDYTAGAGLYICLYSVPHFFTTPVTLVTQLLANMGTRKHSSSLYGTIEEYFDSLGPTQGVSNASILKFLRTKLNCYLSTETLRLLETGTPVFVSDECIPTREDYSFDLDTLLSIGLAKFFPPVVHVQSYPKNEISRTYPIPAPLQAHVQPKILVGRSNFTSRISTLPKGR